jgi:tetratricopeptide (TPR) repeat protein
LNDSVDHYLSLIDLKDPSMMIKIAQVYRSIESYENAIEYYRRAMNMNPRLPQPYIGLYTLYLEKNDTSSAVQIINDWLKMNPADTSASNLLKSIKGQ